jgi:hypothetical protein
MADITDNLSSLSGISDIIKGGNTVFLAQLSLKGMDLLGIAPNMKQSEKYGWQNRISGITIENGTEISDHIVNGPLTISQRFLVTVMSRHAIEGTAKIAPIVYLLTELRKSKQLTSVLTSHGIYKNMAIQSLDAEIAEGYQNTLTCDITFKEIIFADTEENNVAATSRYAKVSATKDKIFNKSAARLRSGNVSVTAEGT